MTISLRWGQLASPIFVDASAWVALANRRDQNHMFVDGAIREFAALQLPLVTTNWTVYEAVSMIKSRSGWNVADEFWAFINDQESISMTHVDQVIERRALELFFSYRDKTWGVVDCASLVIMEEAGCRHALAFDAHFVEASRQRGFQVIPSTSH